VVSATAAEAAVAGGSNLAGNWQFIADCPDQDLNRDCCESNSSFLPLLLLQQSREEKIWPAFDRRLTEPGPQRRLQL
jgi:hypothetical protein